MSLLKLILSSFFKKPFTLRYPKEKEAQFRGLRARHIYRKNECIFCGACVRACPVSCIVVNRVKKTYTLDRRLCIFCGKCEEVCPVKPKAIVLGPDYEYADKNKDKFILRA